MESECEDRKIPYLFKQDKLSRCLETPSIILIERILLYGRKGYTEVQEYDKEITVLKEYKVVVEVR